MIDYVTQENNTPNDIKKAFKYPYNACELLCSDSSYITDIIFQETIIYSDGSSELVNEEEQIIINDDEDENGEDTNDSHLKRTLPEVSQYKVLEYFLSFLDSQYMDNDVLCGYFSKIFNKLIKCQGLLMINYLFNDEKTYLKKLISQLENNSICQCLYSLLVYNCKSEMIKSKKAQLFQMVINQLIIDHNNTIISICDMLSNLFCNEQFVLLFFDHIDLFNSFYLILNSTKHNKESCLLKLIIQIIDIICKYHSPDSLPIEIIANNLEVINTYEYDPNAYLFKDNKSILAKSIKDSIQLQINTILNIISQLCLFYLPDMQNPLIIDSNSSTFINTYNIIQIRLGNEKMLIIALIRSLFIIFHQYNVYNKTIKKTLNILCERKIMKLLIDVFFTFELCNIIHHHFFDIVKIILINSIFDPLIHELLSKEKGNLLSKLISYLSSQKTLMHISENKATSCLFASVITMTDIIYMSTNKTVLGYTVNDKVLDLIHNEIVNRVMEIFNRTLLYDNNEIITNEDNETQEEDIQLKTNRSQYSIQTIIERGLKKLKEYKSSISNTSTLPFICDASDDLDTSMVCDSQNNSMNEQMQYNAHNELSLCNNDNDSIKPIDYDDNLYWKPSIIVNQDHEDDLLNEIFND